MDDCDCCFNDPVVAKRCGLLLGSGRRFLQNLASLIKLVLLPVFIRREAILGALQILDSMWANLHLLTDLV